LRRFRREVEQFLAETAPLDFAAVRERLSDLGCRWIPSSREALVALLTEAEADRRRTT
jgi:hypothetical protein